MDDSLEEESSCNNSADFKENKRASEKQGFCFDKLWWIVYKNTFEGRKRCYSTTWRCTSISRKNRRKIGNLMIIDYRLVLTDFISFPEATVMMMSFWCLRITKPAQTPSS